MTQSPNAFLETADAIGARLCRDALWAGARCNWLGPSMEFVSGNWRVVQRAFGPELYNGTSGIALFLASLHEFTGERIFKLTALAAARQALSRASAIVPTLRIAFYSGLVGIAYAHIRLGELFGDDRLIDDGLELLEKDVSVDLHGQELDVIAGYAGAIPPLLALFRRYGKQFLLDLALRCGDRLVRAARRQPMGWSWDTLRTPGDEERPNLTGFSHGAGGIAWALLELHGEVQEERFSEAAEQGFRYERHWFSPQHGNWPDFRNQNEGGGSGQEPVYMVAWCHGAPGIGLSRVRAYQLTGVDAYRDEAEAAIRTTMSSISQSVSTGQGNYSLCHGIAGNADLLVYASRVLESQEYKTFAERVGEHAIERYERARVPWPCGVMGAGETPNLMLGVAGIGYFFLRLYDPVKVPSILIIPPGET